MSNNIGERNRLLTIKKRSGAKDAANQPLDDWAFVMQRWGKPLTTTGMSSIRDAQAGVPASPTRYSWRINYTPVGIDVGMRAEYKGFVFDILEIRHDLSNREYTDLVCETGASNG